MKKITRRKFVKTSAAIGGTTIVGSQIPAILKAGIPDGDPDIVTLSGNNPMENMHKQATAIQCLPGDQISRSGYHALPGYIRVHSLIQMLH